MCAVLWSILHTRASILSFSGTYYTLDKKNNQPVWWMRSVANSKNDNRLFVVIWFKEEIEEIPPLKDAVINGRVMYKNKKGFADVVGCLPEDGIVSPPKDQTGNDSSLLFCYRVV